MNKRYSKLILVLTIIVSSFFVARQAVAQSSYSLRSPDQRIEVRIRLADRIRYDVLLNGKTLLQDSMLSLKTSSTALGLNPRVKDAKKCSVDQWMKLSCDRSSRSFVFVRRQL